MDSSILVSIAGMIALAGPLIFAVVGETLTEKAGIINLSLNGTILLAAMSSFVIATDSNNLFLGFLTGGLIGMFVALIVAFSSISLKLSQVAIGFVLSVLCANLAYFVGNPFIGRPGIRVPHMPIPGLISIPILGPIFFNQDILVYASYLLIICAYLWIFRTRNGLMLQGIGEKPLAAFTRGINVNKLRIIYTAIGGFLVGLAGPMYSLSVKVGWNGFWNRRVGLDCTGYHYFWCLEPDPGSDGCVFVRLFTMAWDGASAQSRRFSLPGAAGGAFSINDIDSPTGKFRKYRMG